MIQFISADQLAERYGVNRSTIWRWAASGTLPKPIKIAPATTRWRLADIEQRDTERDGTAA